MPGPFEMFFNSLNDTDWLWWPFLKWRPSQKEDFSDSLVFKLLIVGGVIGLALLALLFYAKEGRIDFLVFGIAASCGLLAGYLSLKFGFAAAWNRRAKRLRS